MPVAFWQSILCSPAQIFAGYLVRDICISTLYNVDENATGTSNFRVPWVFQVDWHRCLSAPSITAKDIRMFLSSFRWAPQCWTVRLHDLSLIRLQSSRIQKRKRIFKFKHSNFGQVRLSKYFNPTSFLFKPRFKHVFSRSWDSWQWRKKLHAFAFHTPLRWRPYDDYNFSRVSTKCDQGFNRQC